MLISIINSFEKLYYLRVYEAIFQKMGLPDYDNLNMPKKF